MSSPGLRPYNGSVVRKKRRKSENKAVLCDYVRAAASSSKSVTPLRPPRLVLYRALSARSNQSAGVDTPEPGAAPRADRNGGQTGEDHGSQQLFDRFADRLRRAARRPGADAERAGHHQKNQRVFCSQNHPPASAGQLRCRPAGK